MTQAWLNRIGTAVPPHDIHAEFAEFGRDTIVDTHKRALFDRMASLADIDHRYAIFEPGPKPRDKILDATGFYRRGAFPSTAARMELYQPHALHLALRAVRALNANPDNITHLIVASCTGFTAPGLDFQIMREAMLPDSTERTIVGFMGCFAAVNALKLADHIVRANTAARVLVVNLELCSLHLQEDFQDVPKMLSFLLFGDGASAALVTADPQGIALGRFRAAVIPRSQDLITWQIGDSGFEMHLSGQVPGRIRRWLPEHGSALLPGGSARTCPCGRSTPAAARSWMRCNRRSRWNPRSCASLAACCAISAICPRPPSCSCWTAFCATPTRAAPAVGMAFGPGLTVETFAFDRP